MKKIRCENCDCTEDIEAEKHIPLTEVDNLAARISPGERVPAGECPDCGAFVHLDNMTVDEAMKTLKDCLQFDDPVAKEALDLLEEIFKTANLTFHCPRCTGTFFKSDQVGNALKRTCRSCVDGDRFTWFDRDDDKHFTWAIHLSKESMGRK